MTKLVKELQESSYQESVSIYKEYYKHIIGKNGLNINRIRDDTQTRIELPSQGDGRITVIGKQANVEKAIAQLNKIQNELVNYCKSFNFEFFILGEYCNYRSFNTQSYS